MRKPKRALVDCMASPITKCAHISGVRRTTCGSTTPAAATEAAVTLGVAPRAVRNILVATGTGTCVLHNERPTIHGCCGRRSWLTAESNATKSSSRLATNKRNVPTTTRTTVEFSVQFLSKSFICLCLSGSFCCIHLFSTTVEFSMKFLSSSFICLRLSCLLYLLTFLM